MVGIREGNVKGKYEDTRGKGKAVGKKIPPESGMKTGCLG